MKSVIESPASPQRVLSPRRTVHRGAGSFAGVENTVPDLLLSMQLALHASGGVVTGDTFNALLRCHCDQPLSRLARWIVNREIVSFELHTQRWLPMFQFVLPSMTIHPGVGLVVRELSGVFDELELAQWFVTPNSWLAGALPAVLIYVDAEDVLAAARADRFIAAG